MTATAGQIVVLLDSVARQLQAGNTDVLADCSRLSHLCRSVPQQLSAGERQALIRQAPACFLACVLCMQWPPPEREDGAQRGRYAQVAGPHSSASVRLAGPF